MDLLIAILIALGFSITSADFDEFKETNPYDVDRAQSIIDNNQYTSIDGGGIIIEEGTD